MIGVLADEAEHSVISEFFELFKTPWEFYRETSRYHILICSETSVQNTSAKLIFIYGSKPASFDRENGIETCSQRSNRVLSYEEKQLPIYGRCLTFRGEGTALLKDTQTLEPAVLEISSHGRRVIRAGFNLFHEVSHLLGRGQPTIHAGTPTLELHIALLRNVISSCSIPFVEIPPLPAGYPFIACLTHDVDHAGICHHKCDHTMLGFLYRATIGSLISFCRGRRSFRQLAANLMAAFSLPLVYLGWIKDFWSRFDHYIELEKEIPSTFFIIPKKMEAGEIGNRPAPWKRAAKYDVSDVPGQIRRLVSGGREIGLHGIDAWRDATKGSEERKRIERVTGSSNSGVRMHWLYFDEDSPAALERAGFSYDSTIGYNETVGYRAGTTQVFKPIGLERMLELPMHIMDTALFYPTHLNLTPKQAKSKIQPLLEDATGFGGVLTINWHDRSIAPERLWGDFYVGLLDELKSKDPWFATANQATSWFQKRRSATFESVTSANGANQLKISLGVKGDKLPGLRLRVHKTGGNFVDALFNEATEIEV